jgi:hypothetical protein
MLAFVWLLRILIKIIVRPYVDLVKTN